MPYADLSRKRAYQAAWIAARRAKWIAAMGGSCVSCGATEPLEVDHVDPEKKITHRVWSWTEKRLVAELMKCQLLCHDCHRGRTIRMSRRPVVHGRATTYDKRKCRCGPCRSAKAEYVRTRRCPLVAPSA